MTSRVSERERETEKREKREKRDKKDKRDKREKGEKEEKRQSGDRMGKIKAKAVKMGEGKYVGGKKDAKDGMKRKRKKEIELERKLREVR